MAQHVWTLALYLGLMETRLNIFHGGTDGDDTPGTWGQPSVSTQINLTARPHPPTWVPGNPVLMTLQGPHFRRHQSTVPKSFGFVQDSGVQCDGPEQPAFGAVRCKLGARFVCSQGQSGPLRTPGGTTHVPLRLDPPPRFRNQFSNTLLLVRDFSPASHRRVPPSRGAGTTKGELHL